MNQPADAQPALRSGGLAGSLVGQDLRRLQWDGEEVLNRLYFAVRDRTWATLPGDAQVTLHDEDALEWTARYRIGTGTLLVRASLQLHPDSLACTMSATAEQRVEYNRIGWCLLLPLSFADAPAAFVDPLGATHPTRLPRLVAPQPLGPAGPEPAIGPFRQFSFQGVRAGYRIAASGELFELEDQRNWTDASFKIYSTPLATPRPLTLEAGATLRQEVRLTREPVPTGPAGQDLPHAAAPPPTHPGHAPESQRAATPPRLSAVLSTATSEDLDALRLLGIDLVRVETPTTAAALDRADGLLRQAKDAGLGTELTLWCDDETPWPAVAELVNRYRPELVLALHAGAGSGELTESTSAELIDRAASALAGTPVGGGTPFNLCELQRHPMSHLPTLTCAFVPTVHATDELSVLETPAALPDLVRTLRARAPHAGLALGPFQGRERGPGESVPSIAGLPAEWLRHSLAELAAAGVDRLCIADVRDLIHAAAPTAYGTKVAEYLAEAVGYR